MQRDSVAASSLAGARVDFAPGLKTLALTVGANWFAARDAEAALCQGALAAKQPLSTTHDAAATGAAADQITVRRRTGWVNVPLASLPYRDAGGRHLLSGTLDALDGSAAAPAIRFAADPGNGLFRGGANMLGLATAGTERMRVTDAGRVGIDTLSPARAFVVSKGGANGFEIEPGDGNYSRLVSYNRSTSLRTPIYLEGGSIRLMTGSSGLPRWWVSDTGIFEPWYDNAHDVGSASSRVRVVYAATGAINTSDAREKTWRSAPTAAELAAARRIVSELGFFQWNDAIADKGADGARYHFGVRAQAVWAIMADEGLIAPQVQGNDPDSRYGFLCWDQWDDVSEEEPVFSETEVDTSGAPLRIGSRAAVVRAGGDRVGIRSDQLALFLIAAQEARIAALEVAA